MNAKFCLTVTGRGSDFRRHYAEVNSRLRKRKSPEVEENCATKKNDLYSSQSIMTEDAPGSEGWWYGSTINAHKTAIRRKSMFPCTSNKQYGRISVDQSSIHWRLIFIRNVRLGPINDVKTSDLPSDYQLLHGVKSLSDTWPRPFCPELVSILLTYMSRNNVSECMRNFMLQGNKFVEENLEICSNVISLCESQIYCIIFHIFGETKAWLG